MKQQFNLELTYLIDQRKPDHPAGIRVPPKKEILSGELTANLDNASFAFTGSLDGKLFEEDKVVKELKGFITNENHYSNNYTHFTIFLIDPKTKESNEYLTFTKILTDSLAEQYSGNAHKKYIDVAGVTPQSALILSEFDTSFENPTRMKLSYKK